MLSQGQIGNNAKSKSCPGLVKSKYADRLHNTSLAKLNISQLSAKMEYHGIDAAGIRFKVIVPNMAYHNKGMLTHRVVGICRQDRAPSPQTRTRLV
jgi:hypothetical protein